ncbi:MAG: ATP-binding protein [Chromatiaceae bacterium]|jgi:signal transduction histidine kinase
MNDKITILFVSASHADELVLTTLFSQQETSSRLQLVPAASARAFYDALYAEQSFQIIVIDQQQAWESWHNIAATCSEQRPNALLVLLTDDNASVSFVEAIAVSYPRSSAGLIALSRLIVKLSVNGQAFGLDDTPPMARSAIGQETGEERERLMYAVSHDLQDPLQLARRYADILTEDFEGELGEAGSKVLGHLLFNLTRTQEILDDLLDFSRLQSTAPEREPVDFNELLGEALDLYRVTLDEIGASVSKQHQLPRLNVDRRQFQRVFQNLIGNAIKFRSDKPLHLTVRAQRVRDEWRIGVKDNGVGIADDDAKRIFGMFERAVDAADQPGSGMGLAICKRIIENHGGKIWVRSSPGSGSVFIFSIPQSDEVVEALTD